MKTPHALRNLAKERGLAHTAEGYSACGVYSPRADAVPVDADVSHLATALQKYWQTEGIDGGVYPTGATIILGTRIKLWAHQTHVDIGDWDASRALYHQLLLRATKSDEPFNLNILVSGTELLHLEIKGTITLKFQESKMMPWNR